MADDQSAPVSKDSDSLDVEPNSSGSLGEQEVGGPGTSIVPVDSDTEMTHIGALLGQHLDSGSPFLRGVAYAALRDAEASRRFLEQQLEGVLAELTKLRERVGTAERQVAVLKSILGERTAHQVVFGIGAAFGGAALSAAFVQKLAVWQALAFLVGVVLMFFSRGSGDPGEDI